MHSLRTKLLLTFALVALLGVGTIAVVTNWVTARQFTLYVNYGGQVRAEMWAQQVAEYDSGAWESIEAIFQSALLDQVARQGQGQGRGWGGPNTVLNPDDRFLIVAPGGAVVFDTEDGLIGEFIDAKDLKYGAPIVVDGQTVGTLLITTRDLSGQSELEHRFLDAVDQAVLWAVLLVAAASLVAAVVLSRQLVAPLRQLTAAAETMAQGDLSQRVEVQSRDEVGALGAAFNKMAGDLETAETRRQQMTADIAHELRNPLSVIRGNLEAMLDGIYLPDAEHLALIHEETLLLQRLVEDLRLLTLVDAGRLALVRQGMDVVDLLSGVANSARAVSEDKGIALHVDAPHDTLVIHGDADRLRQVVGNLVSNAIRYTPRGGTITLRAYRTAQDVHISVSDTGQGISSQDLPYVFDRFYRADAARDRAAGGSGLGLAISRALVEAHGGAIEVESRLGRGTTFDIALPRE